MAGPVRYDFKPRLPNANVTPPVSEVSDVSDFLLHLIPAPSRNTVIVDDNIRARGVGGLKWKITDFTDYTDQALVTEARRSVSWRR
jgi:hypothetical protein